MVYNEHCHKWNRDNPPLTIVLFLQKALVIKDYQKKMQGPSHEELEEEHQLLGEFHGEDRSRRNIKD